MRLPPLRDEDVWTAWAVVFIVWIVWALLVTEQL